MHVKIRQGAALVCLMLVGYFQLSTAGGGGDGGGPVVPGPSTTPSPSQSTTTTTTTTPAPPPTTTTAASTTPSSSPEPTTATTTVSTTATAAPATAKPTTTPTGTAPPASSTTAPSESSTSEPAVSPSSSAAASQPTDAAASSSSSPTPASTIAPGSSSPASVTQAPASDQPSHESSPSSSEASGATGSTAAPSSTDTPASSSTAAPTSTTPAPTSAPQYPTKKIEKPFPLDFKIGSANDSAVSCAANVNCTFIVIEDDVRNAFSSVPGYLYVTKGGSNTNRRRRDTQVAVVVLFDPARLTAFTKEDRTQEILEALTSLGSSSDLQVDMAKANATIVTQFVAADVCQTPGACTAGYQCREASCHHLCQSHSCGEHGDCKALIADDGTASATCVCRSDDDHTYSGDQCQDEEMSKAKVAAILGGVLGSFCALFLIIIIFLCWRMRSDSDSGSRGHYQLGGHSNNGYADHELKDHL